MKNWLHFILHEDGRSIYQDTNKSVSSTVQPTPLVNTPDGWKDISIGYERDFSKFSLMKTFTFPLAFVLDGARILRDFIYKAGIEFSLYYLITQRRIEMNPSDFKDFHTKWFRGEVDLTSFKDEEDKIVCTIGPTGLEKDIKANENTEYEIPMSDAEAIYMDGMYLVTTANYQGVQDVEYNNQFFTYDHAAAFGFVNKEGNTYGVSIFGQTIQSITTTIATYKAESDNFFIGTHVSSEPVELVISGKLVVRITQNNNTGTIRFILAKSLSSDIQISPFLSQTGIDHIIPINMTVTLLPGEHLFLLGRHGTPNPGSIGFKYLFMDGSDIQIKFKNKKSGTYIKGFSPSVLLDKLVEKITGKPNKSVSDLLSNTDFQQLYITSGDAIRGLQNASVKISLKKFMEIYGVLSFASQSILNDKFYVEAANNMFDNILGQEVDLGEAKTLKVSAATDLLGNTIDIGHTSKDVDGVNGKFMFNTTHKYSTDLKKSTKKLSFISPAIADPYIIENTRINFDGKKTTDSNKDNEIFIINAKKSVKTGVIGNFSGTQIAPYASGTNIKFLNWDNVGLSANSDISIFTWLGQSVFVDLVLTIVPVSTPANNTVILTLFINDVNIFENSVIANGTNSLTISVPIVININDSIRFETRHSPLSATIGTTEITSAIGHVHFATLEIASLFRKTYTTITGVTDNTVFNIELLSPKRILFLWRKYLNSVLYKFDNKFIKYETSDRNPELYTQEGTIIFDEDADVVIGNELLFKPIVFEIETEVPIDLVDILDTNPNKVFKFSWSGNEYKGFLMKGGIAPDDNRNQVFTLLCTPDTDETKLIA